MNEYIVSIPLDACVNFRVQAENEQEAEKIALRQWLSDSNISLETELFYESARPDEMYVEKA